MKVIKVMVSIVLVAFFAIACGADKEKGNAGNTVKDMSGRSVEVPADPQRILALSPGTLRLVVYLQSQDRVVGIEEFELKRKVGRPYWLAHPELHTLPVVTPGGPASINREPDIEKVLGVNPDLIFVSSMTPAVADSLQQKTGIPVVVISYGRKFGVWDDTLYNAMTLMGKVLDKEKRAAEVIDFIKKTSADVESRADGETVAEKVYIGAIGFKGLHGIESTVIDYFPFQWNGITNVAHKGESAHRFVGREELMALNPDIIFIDGGGLKLVRQDYGKKPEMYTQLKAFQNRKMYMVFPFNYYLTNVGTVLANGYAVGAVIHPEKFGDVDIKAKTDEIYKFLVGAPMYAVMEKSFGTLAGAVSLGDAQ